MTYYNYYQRFLIAGIISMFTVVLSVGVALAEEVSVSNTSDFPGSVQLVTEGADGKAVYAHYSFKCCDISDDGSFVFMSDATNLVMPKISNTYRIYFYDNLTKKVLVLPEFGNDRLDGVKITDDKTWIMIQTFDYVTKIDKAFLYNTSTTELIPMVKADGTTLLVGGLDVTADDSIVAFSTPTRLDPADTNSKSDLYLWNRDTKAIYLVSTIANSNSAAGIGPWRISADDTFVAYIGVGNNFPDCGIRTYDIYRKNIATGDMVCVTAEIPENNQEYFNSFQMSADGNVFVFTAIVIEGVNPRSTNLYLVDLTKGTTPTVLFNREEYNTINHLKLTKDGKNVIYSKELYGKTTELCTYNVQTATHSCIARPTVIRNGDLWLTSPTGRYSVISSWDHMWVGSTVENKNSNGYYDNLFLWDREGTNYSITGQVTGDDGVTGLPNVNIKGSNQEVYITNATGYYTIPYLLADTTYIITPTVAGKTFYPPNTTVTVPTEEKVNFTMKQWFVIAGSVFDPSGQPIERAHVKATNSQTGQNYETSSGVEFGNYMLTVPVGKYTISAEKADYIFNQLDELEVNQPVQDLNIYGGLPHDPVVFIPGISGSQLHLKSDISSTTDVDETNLEVWPAELRWVNGGVHKYLTLKPGDPNRQEVYTDDALRKFLKLNQGYSKLITSFREAGYLEYETGGNPSFRTFNGCQTGQKASSFYVFPWDWRYGVVDVINTDLNLPQNEEHIARLKEYVMCIGRIHPGKKVIIVAHSMGGLIARKYILDYSATKDHNVSKLITIGTPWLGAPKTINGILTGNFDWLLISSGTLRRLVEYMPGVHQLLPTKQYFQQSNESPLVILEPRDPYASNHTRVPVPYGDENDGFGKILRSLYRPIGNDPATYITDQTFVSNSARLFSDPTFSDWRTDSTDVEYYIIYGEGVTPDTIGSIEEVVKTWCRISCVKWIETEPQYVMGDGTVPLVSSSRYGNGDLNKPGSKIYRFKAADFWLPLPNNWGDENTTHLGLTSNTRVLNCIMVILGHSSQPCQHNNAVITAAGSTVVEAEPAHYLRLSGVKEVNVTDGISLTGNILSTAYQPISGVTYSLMGDHGVVLILQPTKQFTVTVKSDEFFDAVAEYGIGKDVERRVHFADVPVSEDTVLDIGTSLEKVASLTIDVDGDAQPETIIAPVSDVGVESKSDITPPVIKIDYDQASQQVSITATDDLSGVSRIIYSIDGVTFTKYTGLLQPGQEVTTVFAQAEDGSANLSSVISKQLTGKTENPSIFLPLVIR